MALAWPDVDELKQLLDVTSNDFDDHLTSLLESGIDIVQDDCGLGDEGDPATEGQRQAALRAAVVMRTNGPESESRVHQDGRYQSHLYGTRKRFGFK